MFNLFGEPVEPEVVQGELLGPGETAGAALRAAEAGARRTITRLRYLVRTGQASRSQLEEYREALALLRRALKYSDEEITLRVRLGRGI